MHRSFLWKGVPLRKLGRKGGGGGTCVYLVHVFFQLISIGREMGPETGRHPAKSGVKGLVTNYGEGGLQNGRGGM